MSFSFRNLFNQEGEIPFDDTASANIDISNQSENPFSADRAANPEPGVRGRAESPSATASKGSLSFTVGELLAFIPPAISAQSGIATEQIISVPAPKNGLHEITLSTLYQVCPNLFAAEITPLNDSVIPLPSQESDASENEPPSQPAQANQPSAGNPFWSESKGSPPANELEPKPAPSTPGNAFSDQGTSPPAMKGFAPATPKETTGAVFQPGLGESLIIGGADQNGFPEAPQQEVPSAPQETAKPEEIVAPAPSQSDETGGFISKENPFLSDSESPSDSDIPNLFDSGPDFSTLFSKEAEAENEAPKQREIPVRDATGKVSKFSAHVSPPSPQETPPLEKSPAIEDSIFGKPSVSGFPEPENIEINDDDDFSAFIPPTAEELTVPDIPALRETEEKSAPQSETAEMEQFVFQNAPAPTNPAASTGFVDAISEIPPLDTPAPEIEAQFPGGFSPATSTETLPGQPLEENVVTEPQSTQVSIIGKSPPINDEAIRDIELRAVFGTNESFTLRKIATLVTCMPGVSACAISTPAQALQASRDECATIGEEAATLAVTVRELAKLTGSPDAQSFTINTDKGILSIFVSDECYLTVQHDPGKFEPGVQEKLILVSRSLGGIEE